MQQVRPFSRTIEPSFPDNDALPKKNEDEVKFDKRFNEWYDDVKVNLDRLQDQLTTIIQSDIEDSIDTQKKITSQSINLVNSNLLTSIADLKSNLQSIEDNLYSV
jgi:hypothetical protein